MFDVINLPRVKFVNMYTKPINMRWGENKLKNLCIEEMKIDPKKGEVFLFFNKAMDQLKLFFIDDISVQEVVKALPKGGFMLPVAKENDIVVKVERKKLDAIFKSKLGKKR